MAHPWTDDQRAWWAALREHAAAHIWADGIIYFIVAGDKIGHIKIGWTKRNPRARLRSLRVGSPYPLELHACIPGTREQEAQLHAEFARHRVSGEWFRPTDGILDFFEWARPEPRRVDFTDPLLAGPSSECEHCVLWREFTTPAAA